MSIDTTTTKLAFSITEAARRADAGRTSIYRAISAGELVCRKRGRRSIILAEDLNRWLSALPTFAPKANPGDA